MPFVVAISSNEIWLALVGGLFIAFALVVSFVLPRRNPSFPGSRVGAFVAVTAVLFAAMIATVVLTAGGEEGEHGQAEPAETEAAATTTTGGTTEAATTEAAATTAAGDPAAGEQVFASAGCGGCHTLQAAGSSGNVGPNLDDAKPSFDLAVDRVTHGKDVMPPFAGQLSDAEIRNVAAYVVESTKG